MENKNYIDDGRTLWEDPNQVLARIEGMVLDLSDEAAEFFTDRKREEDRAPDAAKNGSRTRLLLGGLALLAATSGYLGITNLGSNRFEREGETDTLVYFSHEVRNGETGQQIVDELYTDQVKLCSGKPRAVYNLNNKKLYDVRTGDGRLIPGQKVYMSCPKK